MMHTIEGKNQYCRGYWMGKVLRRIFLLLLLSSFLVSGCSIHFMDGSGSMGRMEGRTYINDYFELSFNIPEDWSIATEKEKYGILLSSISEDDEESKKQLDVMMTKVLYLIYTSKYPLDFSCPNPNFQCYAEKLESENTLSIKSGRDYLKRTIEQMNESGSPYVFSNITSETLGGKLFYTVKIGAYTDDTVYIKKFYSAVIKGYAVNFMITYTDSDGFTELDNMIKSIRFNWPVHEQQVIFFANLLNKTYGLAHSISAIH